MVNGAGDAIVVLPRRHPFSDVTMRELAESLAADEGIDATSSS